MRPTRLTAAALSIAALAAATAALAHHGRHGAYDITRPIALDGVVTAASFTPPHPVITVRVDARPRAAGEAGFPGFEGTAALNRREDAGAVRVVEFSPLPQFLALREKVAVGQRIQVMVFRNCVGDHDLRGQWVRLADGTTAQRDGRPTSAVTACPAPR
jgi:hypothetical protein